MSMPVYHYTYHAYGTWLPDRTEGYHAHGQGYRSSDLQAADRYRERMQKSATRLQAEAISFALGVLRDSRPLQRFDLYAVAGELTHLHIVVAWRDKRKPTHVQGQIKATLTRALNKRFGKQKWFGAKAGQTQVVDEPHLDELVNHYLPKHGLYWKCDENCLDT